MGVLNAVVSAQNPYSESAKEPLLFLTTDNGQI